MNDSNMNVNTWPTMKLNNSMNFCKILGCHSGEYSDYGPLGRDTYTIVDGTHFWRNVLLIL